MKKQYRLYLEEYKLMLKYWKKWQEKQLQEYESEEKKLIKK